MNKRIALLLVGGALMLGYAAYDRANRSETVIPASVVSVQSTSANAGTDTWAITVLTDSGEVTLEPEDYRPNLSSDTQICVTRITRMGRADQYRRAPSDATC